MLNRRSALAILAGAGVGTAVFQRALAAKAEDGPVSLQMVADAEWVAGIKLSEPQREAVVNALNDLRYDLEHIRALEFDISGDRANATSAARSISRREGRDSRRRRIPRRE